MSELPKRKSNHFDQGGAAKKSQRNGSDRRSEMNDDSDDDIMQFDDDDDSADEEVIVAGDDDDEEDQEMAMGDEEKEQQQDAPRVWRPGIDKLEEGEVLEHDPAAYKVYETAMLEWPSLSFDILNTPEEVNYKVTFPAKIFAVCGTQTDGVQNKVNVLLMENVCESKVQDDDDDGGFDIEGKEEEEHEGSMEPVMHFQSFNHDGCVNRIKAMPQNQRIIATMNDRGVVALFDINPHLQYLRQQRLSTPDDIKPFYTFNHGVEGYGLAWSPVAPILATGDRNGNIYLHSVVIDGDNIQVSTLEQPYSRNSPGNWIEAIEWSPNQANIFATADTQGVLTIWRTGIPKRTPFATLQAHDTEINTLSWNKTRQSLLATGDDNGVIKVWDMNYIAKGPEVAVQATYSYHKKAITSLQWHPHEYSMLVVASEDDSTTVWDFSNEADQNEIANEATGAQMIDYEIPGQLLFQHMGQQEVKEVAWHPQYTSLILSTAASGIDIYKPSNIDVVLADPNAAPSEEIPVD